MLSIVLGSGGMSEKNNQTPCPCEVSIYQNKILHLDLALRKKNSSSHWISGLRFKNQDSEVGGTGP